jgi:hypothetical protein
MDDFEDIDGLVEMEMELNGEEAGEKPPRFFKTS